MVSSMKTEELAKLLNSNVNCSHPERYRKTTQGSIQQPT